MQPADLRDQSVMSCTLVQGLCSYPIDRVKETPPDVEMSAVPTLEASNEG